MDVHAAARIMAAAHGGQVLLSGATQSLARADVTRLGTHRLKDLDHPVALFQLGSQTFPPLRTVANTNLPVPASSFLGREPELAEGDQQMISMALSEARDLPMMDPYHAYWERAAETLATAWRVRGRRRANLKAAIALAVSFDTHRTLTRDQHMTDEQATTLMTRLAESA